MDYLKYTEDFIYDANWKWKWSKNKLINLQCYCPNCGNILVYDDTSYMKPTELTKTDFICENCNSKIVSTIHGGNKNYAINAIKREIERKIRINGFQKN